MVLKPYFDTEGPHGLPMKDKQALALEERLKNIPKDDAFAFRRLSMGRGLAEFIPEGRTDVSWITEESPDRTGDVVLAAGMDDAHFQLNPIVTLNHCYTEPPVGRSLWRKKIQEGSLVGIKAKTHYPARPEAWSGDWLPDFAFDLVQSGLLRGKSIGFFPLKLRAPTHEERAKNPALKGVRHIIEEWILAEYACCYLPMQPHAVVEQVNKSLADLLRPTTSDAPMSLPWGFTALGQVERYLRSEEFRKSVQKAALLSYQKATGRV